MCSDFVWSEHNLNTPRVQILFDLNIIWTRHVFRCWLIWTQSEHTMCSDIVWSEDNLNTSCVHMLFDLNTIWTHHVFRYCLIWTQSEHIICSCLVWSGANCVCRHSLNMIVSYCMFKFCRVWGSYEHMSCAGWVCNSHIPHCSLGPALHANKRCDCGEEQTRQLQAIDQTHPNIKCCKTCCVIFL